MLSLLILWTISGIIFAFIGTPILHACNLQTYLLKTEDQIFVAIWLGMIVLANLLLLASLFLPLNLYIEVTLAALMALPWFFKRSEYAFKDFSINRSTGLGLFVVTLLAIIFTTLGIDSVEDTGAYHYQMINWLADYGSVHGLALINNPFGYTDSWFALIAPLQTGGLRHHFITGMNGFIFYLMAVQTILILRRVLNFNHAIVISDWFFIVAFAFFCRFSFSDLIHSPSPDVPVTLLILIVTWLMVTISISSNAPSATCGEARWPGVAVLILALGTVSIKLGALPLLGVAIIYYLFARGWALRKVLAATAIVIPFVVIHLWVSIVTSGCPLYPAPYFCTDLPWSVGSEVAKNTSAAIFEFLKWVGPAPSDATSFNWLWHKSPNNNFYNDKPLMQALLVANILCGVWLYFKRYIFNKEALLYTALVALAGIVFTIFKLPHLRFGLGFFLVVPALTAALLLMNISQLSNKGIVYLIRLKIPLLFIAACFSVIPLAMSLVRPPFFWIPYDVAIKEWAENAPSLAIWATDGIPPGYVERIIGNNFEYYRPTKSRYPQIPVLCWGAAVPCAQGMLSDIWLRDEKAGFSEGFIKH